MKRIVLSGILIVAVGMAAAVYWLFYDNRPPTEGEFPLEIEELRAEAGSLPGDGPTRIEVETLYRVAVPRIALITGTNWSDMGFIRNSYRLVYPDFSIILDTGTNEVTARGDPNFTDWYPDAWERMQAGLSASNMIIVTHEHCDHIGGLLQSPNWRELMPKAVLNEDQFLNTPECTVWPEGSRDQFKPLNYGGIRAVAPGVVLIRARGHTPGSQMVFVRQADGKEFLFSGDTASSLDNVRLLRPRSRYVMEFGGHEDDRDAVFLQTIAIKRLMEQAPDLVLVPGHDEESLKALEDEGLLAKRFSLP